MTDHLQACSDPQTLQHFQVLFTLLPGGGGGVLEMPNWVSGVYD